MYASTIRVFLLSLLAMCVTNCTLTLPSRETTVRILSYNVQNLFDDHANGNEYEEFDPNRSSWSSAEYYRRLQDFSRVLRDSVRGGPDIIALQEIENIGVLEELNDRFLGGLGYRYTCATEAGASPIVVGVLSRFPIIEARAHSARIDDDVTIRPVLETVIEIRGALLCLFTCHWKSKSGGAEETEPYRIATASAIKSVIKRRLRENPNEDIVVVGDLNERLDEFGSVREAYPTALTLLEDVEIASEVSGLIIDKLPSLDADQRGDEVDDDGSVGDDCLFYSPWLNVEYPGSYMFRGNWERIDHVLLTDNCFDAEGFRYVDFAVCAPGYTIDQDGRPLSYSVRTGTGFSDHLPLLLTIELVR